MQYYHDDAVSAAMLTSDDCNIVQYEFPLVRLYDLGDVGGAIADAERQILADFDYADPPTDTEGYHPITMELTVFDTTDSVYGVSLRLEFDETLDRAFVREYATEIRDKINQMLRESSGKEV